MRIFTLSIFILGCFVLISGTKLEGKLLRALQDIQQTQLESTDATKSNIDDPPSISNVNGNQHESKNHKDAQPSLQLPIYSHKKNPKLEQRPPDEQPGSQNESEKIQSDIIMPDVPPQVNDIADIIQRVNAHGFRNQVKDKDIIERLREVEITHPDNTIIPNVIPLGDLQPNIMTDSGEISEDTQPEIMLPDSSNDERKESGFSPQENTHQLIRDTLMTTNSALKQTQHKVTDDRPSGTAYNYVLDHGIGKEANFRNSQPQTNMDINNNVHTQVNQHHNSTEEPQKCNLRQTMAWQVCNKKMPCSSTCKTGDDCTFPYCNSLGLCECREAECSSNRMCYFWRIECRGEFKCMNSKCICA